MTSSDIVFNGLSMTMTDDVVNYDELLSSVKETYGKENPVLIIDMKGMQKKDIIPDVLKRTKMKRDFWLMTGVHDQIDLIDAFQGDMSKVAVPYHFTNDELLKEMVELSDSCVPSLFVDNGIVHMKGKKRSLRDIIRTLERMNFRKVIVFDVSESDPLRAWESASDLSDTIIPYVSSGSKNDIDIVHKLGFNDVLIPAVRSLNIS
jgi:uncharacterized protein related to proFAR isomerase